MSNAIEKLNYEISVGNETDLVTMELHQSGAFKYGNGTCVVMHIKGNMPQSYDTRYEQGITQNFAAWCDEFLKNCFVKEAVIVRK